MKFLILYRLALPDLIYVFPINRYTIYGRGGARTHREFPKHFFLRKIFSILWHFQNFLLYGPWSEGGGLEHIGNSQNTFFLENFSLSYGTSRIFSYMALVGGGGGSNTW